nr:Phosphatidylinositol 3-kinase and Phosphoinositide 3-kinase and Phosphoinositide 3-kinase accessory region PIK and Phosphatidylinositol 3-4-kinase domain containing protein [Haemonchus contortus]
MSGAAVAASSAGDDLPGPSGSRSSDFMGSESRKKPKRQGSDVRMSRIETVHRTLHGFHQEWEQRKRATFEIDYTNPSILCSSSSDAVSCIELGGLGERQLLTVLLPWMQVTVCCGFEFSLNGLKTELFAKLKRMSVAQFSMNATDYVFQVLRKSTGDMEELYNEEMLLSKIDFTRPYPMLSLFEPESFRHERDLAHVIGQALGYSLDELETKLSDELKTCRAALFKDTVEAVNSRGSEGYEHYAFPEAVVLDVAQPCPHSLIAKIKSANLSYQVFFRTLEDEKENIDHGAAKALVNFVPDMTPTSLVAKVVRDLKRSGHIKAEEVDTDYLLQLVGQKSYLTANDKLLITYGEVRSAFENYRNPRFVLRRKAIVLLDYPKPRPIHKPSYVRAEESRMASEDSAASPSGVVGGGSEPTESHITLWDVDEYLSMRPLSCSSMGTSDMDSQISVDFIVYCGKTSLIHKASSKVPSHNPRWLEGMISFDLYMKDLPPAAVLTVHLVETKMRKGKAEDRVLGWVNIRLFDWRGELLQGVVTLNLWGGEPQYPPHGRIGGNDKKQGSSCRLVIELARYRSQHVRMPDSSQFAPFVRFIRSIEEPQKIQTDDFSIDRILTTIRKRLLGGVVSAEEELFVWNQRHYVSEHLPDALLVIAEAEVTWRKREHFTEIYVMLESWGRLTVGTAFRILSKKCMDPIIRRFAVSQLDIMLDNQSFPLFILPFIQALKCEAWSYNPLSCLLLKKALSDYRIGHKLFWLLRAELANLKDADGNISEMYKRFALIIEAYLRGNDEHIRTVVKQVEMVDYLHRLSLLVKGIREKDAATERLREELRNNCPTLEKIDSPLDPSNALGHLRIDKCRVLGSAKMPLLLSWQNRSPMSEHYLPTYEIIFKNGDDLRQDMLVVQMLELMDSIWKRNQLDCCLSTYPVLPMGTKYGMIGVVPNCSTIFEIQSDGGKVGTAVKSLETTFINRYIKNNAGSTRKYMECVDRFLMSCVGYSVGTFIMGIMDRHNDNIMMTHDGKIFHIDFGHILGHGKTKLGIRRDRVPFVLTEHFLCVIGQGRPVSKDSHEVTKFKKLCCDAYMMLWEERDLFLSLFAVMQSMELPELSTEADLDHLKSTLRVAFHDGMMTEARAFFSEIFDEAFNGSWATKTNWFFHAVKHI